MSAISSHPSIYIAPSDISTTPSFLFIISSDASQSLLSFQLLIVGPYVSGIHDLSPSMSNMGCVGPQALTKVPPPPPLKILPHEGDGGGRSSQLGCQQQNTNYKQPSENSSCRHSRSGGGGDNEGVTTPPSISRHQDFLPCRVVSHTSEQHSMTTKGDVIRALGHLHSEDGNKLPGIAYWAEHGRWPDQLPALRALPSVDPNIYRVSRFLHFTAPVIAVHLNDRLAYAILDTGAKSLLISKPYSDQVCPDVPVEPYRGKPFRQANSAPLPIVGTIKCVLQVGILSSKEEFIIFEAPPHHKEMLVGFDYIRDKKIFVGSDGLYKFPADVLHPSSVQQDFQCPHPQIMDASAHGEGAPANRAAPPPAPANRAAPPPAPANRAAPPPALSDINSHGDIMPPRAQGRGTANGDTTFPITACEAVTILPFQSLLLKCQLQNIREEDMQLFSTGHMACSSERLEPYQSLSKLAIFYQIIPITDRNQTIQLLYFNSQNESVFIDEKQVVAYCEPMRMADDNDMEAFSKIKPACYYAGHVSGASQTKASSLCSPNFSRFEFDPNDRCPSISESAANVGCSDPHYKEKFVQLIKQHAAVFGNSPWSVNSWGSSFELKARPSQVPFQDPVIPCSPRVRRQAAAIISQLLSRGLIQHSKSPYRNSVLFLVKKSADKQLDPNEEIPMAHLRMVLDLRRMSSQLIQNWPGCAMPHIQDVLGYLKGMKYVTLQDFSQGFFGVRLSLLGRHLTAFQFAGSLYEMAALPQGCSPSSAVFQRQVAHLLQTNGLHPESRRDAHGNLTSGVLNFIDDVVCFSVDLESHYKLLSELFSVLSKNKIKLKLSKSRIAEENSLQLLGFEVNLKEGTLGPARKLIDRLLRLKAPTTVRGVRKILGSFTFFSSLIPNFATHMAPLFDLLHVDKKFHFGPKERQAFDFGVSSLARFPVVYMIDVTKPLYTAADAAAGDAISYVIMQWSSDLNSMIPCRFVSHRMNQTQRRYSQVQAECLSLSTFCAENYSLLLYRKNYIYNDSKCLSFISHFRWTNVAIWRHHLLISSLNLQFIWVEATHCVIHICDLLTRPAVRRRPSGQEILKQRISRELVENLPFVSFHGMPELSYNEAVNILDKFHSLCKQLGPKNLAEKWKALLQVSTPRPPQICARIYDTNINVYYDENNNISQDDFLQCCTRISTYSNNYSYEMPADGGVTNMVYITKPSPSQSLSHTSPPSPSPGRKRQKERERRKRGAGGSEGQRAVSPPTPPAAPPHGIAAFEQAQGKLYFYFPGCQVEHLISEQAKDEKLIRLAQNNKNKDYVRIKGVICKVTKYKGNTYWPIAWPQHLSVHLLKKAHVINDILHLRRQRLEANLRPFFYIKNFKQMFDKMDCAFCQRYLKHKNEKIPYGLSFNVSQTRSFLSIDVCVVQSNIEYGSFLQILDICSYFCIAVKCKASPTAREVHEIIWTYWVPFAGVPLCLQFDGGINQSLGHEIAQHFNCREFFISPLNSKAAKCEKVHSLLLHVCRGAHAMGYITGGCFQLWLSLAALLHNSTRNIDGYAPSQLLFQGPPSRTNQFIGFSDLQHQQTKSFLVEKMREATQFLSLVALKRKELNLKKAEQWKDHRQKVHCGDLVLQEQKEVKKPLWKLKPRYKKGIFRVVATRKNYCILLPLSSFLEYVKSPFHRGGKPVQRYVRVDRKYLKLIPDPYQHLGLSRAKHHIEAAAEVLGQHVPVKRIILGPPNSVSRTNHEFYRLFAKPHALSSKVSVSMTMSQCEGQQGSKEGPSLKTLPPLMQQIHSNRTRVDNFIYMVKTHVDLQKFSQPFLPLEGNSHYVLLKSCFSWEKSLLSHVGCPTVPHDYTLKYENDRMRRRQHVLEYLRDVEGDASHQGAQTVRRRQPPHRADKTADDPLSELTGSQLAKVSKFFLHMKKKDMMPLVLSSLDNLISSNPKMTGSCTSSSSSPMLPRRSPQPTTNQPSSPSSSANTSSSGSMHSAAGSSSRGASSVRDQHEARAHVTPAPAGEDPIVVENADKGSLDGENSDDGHDGKRGKEDQRQDGVGQEPGLVISSGETGYDEIMDITVTRGRLASGLSPGPTTSPSMRQKASKQPPTQATSHTSGFKSPAPATQHHSPFSPSDRALVRSPLSTAQAQAAASPAPCTPPQIPSVRPPSSKPRRSSLRVKTRDK